jgi:arsenical pump membrane protein
VATAASVIVLAAVLGVVAWGRVPDALAAVPGAVLVVALGLVTFDDAVDVLDRLLPTLVFLASIFVIAEAVRAAGLFERAGAFLSRSATHPSDASWSRSRSPRLRSRRC